VPVYFISETKRVFWDGVDFILTGEKQWSDQLLYALEKIPFDNIIYSMEDLYFTGKQIDWYSLYSDFIDLDMDCLRLYPGVPYPCYPYVFEHKHTCLNYSYMKIAKGSPYSVSMCCALWKKDFLLSCLVPGENPWEMENDGSDRLNQRDGWGVWNVEEIDMYCVGVAWKGRPNHFFNELMRKL